MPQFSQRSLERLATCHEDLRELFLRVNEIYPCTILCGHRGEAEQTAAYEHGHSRQQWPTSKHNTVPSIAVDVAPDPVDWENEHAFRVFAGVVFAVAHQMGLRIRWGGAWAGLPVQRTQAFNDLPHFELVVK